MKIYLYFNNEGWKLIDSEKEKNFEKLLEERDIVIGDSAEIGYHAKIDYHAKIGDLAEIGDSAEIGYLAEIGYHAKIGNYAEIGDYAEIGNYAKIKDKFNKNNKDVFTEKYIYYMTGILMQNGKGIFYKAVKPNLTCFYDVKYQYKIGKGDKMNIKRDQSIDCGEGWHWTSYKKAREFAGVREHKIISAEIELDDILSVYDKIRVKKFSNVKKINL